MAPSWGREKALGIPPAEVYDSTGTKAVERTEYDRKWKGTIAQ